MSGDIWAKIAAPVPSSIVQWRQQGKPKQRDGKWVAPFVAYIDAQFVRERLDAVVPGEWDLTLDLLPSYVANGDGEANEEPVAFKATLKILAVSREDVGTGKDYKTASTDAFKRAAVRFGIAHELYSDYEIVWVQVDSDSKYAKQVEDPAQVWARRRSGGNGSVAKSAQGESEKGSQHPKGDTGSPSARQQPATESPAPTDADPSCPKCGGRMWDNRSENDARLAKGEKLRPDWKCRQRTCEGVIWRPKAAAKAPTREPEEVFAEAEHEMDGGLPF